jgi:hypothetical protein
MSRHFAVVAIAALLSSPAVMADGSQAKPRPAAKKPAAAAPVAVPAPKVEPSPPPPPPPPGVKLTTAFTQGAQVSENTTYLQGARQRVEFPGVVTLDQCDLRRTVLLNPAAKRYRVQPYPAPGAAPKPPAAEPLDPQAAQMAEMAKMMGQGPKPPQRGGVVTFTTTLTDTLERQQMFGLEARRIRTTVLKQSSSSACDKSPLKIEIDAWYVDLPAQSACARPPAPEAAPAGDPNECTDTIETRAIGDVRLGFPIKLATTTTTGEGSKSDSVSSSQEVTALDVVRLDTELFDVPKDYVEANSTAEIVPSIAEGGSLSEALFGSTADGRSTAAPKKPGIIRIGVLQPLNKVARDLPAAGLREDLVSKFKSGYEAIPLSGHSATAVEADAVRLQCDYVLLTEIVEAKTSKPGKLGGLSKIAGGGPPKDSHDVKVDYKLFAVGATQATKASGNVKASNGGFGIGSALRIAAFAGQMYMGVMMGGMGMGMMNPMMAMSQMGGLGTMGGGLFDPRASAMTSMMSSFGSMAAIGGGAMSDPSEAGMRDTLSEAMANSAKSAMEQLARKK